MTSVEERETRGEALRVGMRWGVIGGIVGFVASLLGSLVGIVVAVFVGVSCGRRAAAAGEGESAGAGALAGLVSGAAVGAENLALLGVRGIRPDLLLGEHCATCPCDFLGAGKVTAWECPDPCRWIWQACP